MSLGTMNWKRGLLRLWAVVAVLWVGVAFYSNDTVLRVRDAYAIAVFDPDAYLASKPQTGFLLNKTFYVVASIWPPLFDFAKLAFIPPLLLLALGYIGLWVGRGFRK